MNMYSILFFVFFLVQFAEHHATSPPEVPHPPPQPSECPFDVNIEGLDMDKMLGYWYITHKTTTIPLELRRNVNHIGCQVLKIVKNEDKYEMDIFILEKNINTHEKYSILPENTRANSTIDDKKIMLAVIKTDYDNNAAIITCEQEFSSHRLGYIVSRTQHSDPAFVEYVKGRITDVHFDAADVELVSQENCRSVD